MSELLYELFVLKAAPIRAAVETALAHYDPALVKSAAAAHGDELVRDYISQIDLGTRSDAERMAEYYKIFYMLENYIRDFVASILEEEVGEDWWDSCVPDAIRDSAKRSREKELSLGVTPRSVDPLEYITFGELSEIMKSNWDYFGGVFPHVKGLENVMSRLNTLRGPIMHCGTLAEDEVLRLKLSMRDWFKLFEVEPTAKA